MADVVREMAAFDRLPRAVRLRLAASRFDFRPTAISADRRAHRLNVPETVALIAALENWARDAEGDAVRDEATNRLTPSAAPRVGDLVRQLRSPRAGDV